MRRRVLRQHLQPHRNVRRNRRAAAGPAPHLTLICGQDARKALLRPVQQGQAFPEAIRCHPQAARTIIMRLEISRAQRSWS